MIGSTISHYKIIEKLGEGGMGIVYKAEDLKLKRTVALKFLSPALTLQPESRERFLQEAQAAAALDHPNICAVYEIDERAGGMFIAMAFIEGLSLKEKIAGGRMAIREALAIANQIADGLRAAHEKGIIHRDIKPGNIMLTAQGQAKIMDFGLARLEWGADLTRTATVMGTLAYMSPEQACGEAVDYRTDLWSLGCVLYEMLAGERPFRSEQDSAVLCSILKEAPRPLSSLRAEVPVDLERIVEKCLEKEPGRRYQDAAALITALKSAAKLTAAPRQPSIVVLPFVDMSAQRDQEYFCDGIAEELINGLTHIKNLKVVARTSAFAFKGKDLDVRELGRRLNVDTVLEGSIRKAGTRLRITAQLINVEDGYHLWSEKFDREMEDIFAVQDEISSAIVEKLKVGLLAQEKAAVEKRHTDDPEAYNLYLKGLYFSYKPSLEALNSALEYFRRAIERDPRFALAHAGIGNVYSFLGVLNLAPPKEMMPKAKAAIAKALELDNELAEAHAHVATVAFYFDWDWEAADRGCRRALAINPGYASAHAWYAWNCLARGRFEEAIREIKLAESLDPLMPMIYALSTGIHSTFRPPEEAIEEFRRATELDPTIGLAYFHAGIAYFRKGSLEEAVKVLKRSKELAVYAGWAESVLGLVALARGERKKAERILEEMLEEKKKRPNVSATTTAFLWGALGDADKAFEYFDLAFAERDGVMPFVHIYTPLVAPSLTKDPRYKALLKKMNL